MVIKKLGIAGFGMAGKMAYLKLREWFPDSEIHIFDQSFEIGKDKIWCHWFADDFHLPAPLSFEWKAISVSKSDQVLSSQTGFIYGCYRQSDLDSYVLQKANSDPKAILKTCRIQSCSGYDSYAEIITENQQFQFDWIFQSAIAPKAEQVLRYPFIQHFLGWEIETKPGVFDASTARLMDFNVSQAHGFAFMYVLPFSSSSSLIEYTLFSKTLLPDIEYEKEIRSYLRSNYDLSEAEVIIKRKEKGAIPMNDLHYPDNSERMVSIGQAGGNTKASTGYTMFYTLKKLDAWRNSAAATSSMYRLFDLTFLEVLDSNPQKFHDIMFQLFGKAGIHTVLTFLNEEASLQQIFQVMKSVPKTQFSRALLKNFLADILR